MPVVLLFSCGLRLDWDFVVDSGRVSLGGFSGILSFCMGSALSLFMRILVPQVILAIKYFIHEVMHV